MQVKDAKAIAAQWVEEQALQLPGFCGALYHGSINWLADDARLAPTSDVDLTLIVSSPEPPAKPGKFVYQGVLLDVSYLAQTEIPSAEVVLGTSHLAGSIALSRPIADPDGWLTALQATVAQNYARPQWVLARCQHAEGKVRRNIASLNPANSLSAQVTSCVFAAGVTTHILLVAGLENPTVRRRYLDVRDLLTRYGHSGFYLTLLELLGCAHMSHVRARQHLHTLADAFDAAASVLKSPFPFANDLTPLARPVALDGSRELIAQGNHHEAVFWIAVTYSRCLLVLEHDAPPELQTRFRDGYEALVSDLKLSTFADRAARCQQIESTLPHIQAVANAIISANPIVEQ